MGYWDKNGSYVYDENDMINFKQELKENGGPDYDVRIGDSEKQINMNPYGEPIRSTGGPDYDERISDSEKQKNMNPYGEPIRSTGGPDYDERISDSEKQKNMNPYGEPIRSTGGPSYDERMNDTEAQVFLAQNRDREKKETLNNLSDNFPTNKDDLVFYLSSIDYRTDLVKKLVDKYKEQFFDIASQYNKDYSTDASKLINQKLTEYLCLIETLKSQGYDFGSNTNKYYDSNKIEPQLEEIMSIMHVRRKNDANVEIIFPIDYDLTDSEYQQTGDAVIITNNVHEHLKNNPYMELIWKKSGYETPESEMKRAV